MRRLLWLSCLSSVLVLSLSRIHHLSFRSDNRRYIDISTFGYGLGSFLSVTVNFSLSSNSYLPKGSGPSIGFTLTKGPEMSEYVKRAPKCVLERDSGVADIATLYFVFNFANNRIKVRQGSGEISDVMSDITICLDAASYRSDPEAHRCLPDTVVVPPRVKRGVRMRTEHENGYDTDSSVATTEGSEDYFPGLNPSENEDIFSNKDKSNGPTGRHFTSAEQKLPNKEDEVIKKAQGFIEKTFLVQFNQKETEGLYQLIFHNCNNYDTTGNRIGIDLNMVVVERNRNSYLATGEMLLPKVLFSLSLLFFIISLIWTFLLKRARNEVFRIHYLMAVLVYLKSLSLLLDGINFFFIGKYGHQQEVWAVVYYIIHLLEGVLLFSTISLIGTGWSFFKGFLTERAKKISMIVIFLVLIPLQVLDNIALIIVDESESGERYLQFWSQIFVLVDLLCCAAIILLVVWSLRQSKAAFDLEKLQLFKRFYLIIICYVYLTRVCKYLVSLTVPFKYSWLSVIVEDGFTWLFFVLTGYLFRPVPGNPYHKLPQWDDKEEWDDLPDVVAQCGAMENVVRIKRPSKGDGSTDNISGRTNGNPS